MKADKPYLTPAQVAARMRVSPITVRGWVNKGLLRAETTPGGHRRFLFEDVEQFARGVDMPSDDQLRVLIVDDDPIVCALLCDALAKAKLITASALSGFEAGRQVLGFKPDVVVLDLMMPGMDGFTVCRLIKADPATRHIRILCITASPTPENLAQAKAAGAEVCLAKPVDTELIAALIGARVEA